MLFAISASDSGYVKVSIFNSFDFFNSLCSLGIASVYIIFSKLLSIKSGLSHIIILIHSFFKFQINSLSNLSLPYTSNQFSL